MLTSSYYYLDALDLFKLNGPDAEMFLQNYTSNNVKKLALGQLQSTCFLNQKGHLIAMADLYKLDNPYLLAISKHKTELLQEHLKVFLMLSDVQLTNVEIEPYREFLKIASSPSGASEWQDLRIDKLFPLDGIDTYPNSLVHELGLQDSHVDFHKGCYLGQEIVARVESRGNVNRSLIKVKLSFQDLSLCQPVELPLTIYLESKKVGEITSLGERIGNHQFGLATLHKDAINTASQLTIDSNIKLSIEVV